MQKNKFNNFFRESAINYWPQECEANDSFYLWFVAQSIAESGLDVRAVSRVGACGLMQLMPATWRDIKLYLHHLSEDIFDPKSNIEAGVWYDRFCWDRLSQIPDLHERLLLSFASYNCGPTRAKKLLTEIGASTFAEIKDRLPRETSFYVERIVKFHGKCMQDIMAVAK
ncbi:transglycosylase SLT domain-containing protein [bacterium]|nr:transglycosylase SLT domain-containing protein [bacterium]